MPGWYIHMDVARKALTSLDSNPGAAEIFGADGPTAGELEEIAQANPAYVALGAIGPDLFFLLPDFKGLVGSALFGAANFIKLLYELWDENFLTPYEDVIGPISLNHSDSIDALTGGLAGQLSEINQRAWKILKDAVLLLFAREYDVFGLLGSGVAAGYDEQTFFWSDMLHYRKTYEFTATLWRRATEGDLPEEQQRVRERLQAFALGWMTHLATDVAGHSFVNEKSGGPYRLHWQRHHLVENHMDASVYDSENGSGDIYQMLSASALHLWIAFNPDGTSRVDMFQTQPGPSYAAGDDTPSILDRKSKWDINSDIPAELARFLVDTLRAVYNPELTGSNDPTGKGQYADHPTILRDILPNSPDPEGYASPRDIATLYFWLFEYVKHTTTDFFKVRRPKEPKDFNIPPFPSPPGTGASDPGPGSTDDGWADFFKILLAIFAWFIYLAEVSVWPAEALIGLITSAGSRPVRELLYENVELPLYNAWAALHWYLAISGFVYPMKEEINDGLMTLGIGVGDAWKAVQDALQDPRGGLIAPPLGTEPSGNDLDPNYPHDVVQDPPTFLTSAIDELRELLQDLPCPSGERPSEFLRPWFFPLRDNQDQSIPPEFPLTAASPYRSTQDATALLQNAPGHNPTRVEFENAQREADTIDTARLHLPLGEHLGDPVDYSAYVIARLTRNFIDEAGGLPNFNLDADRGYGYLCWDWVRASGEQFSAAPRAYRNVGDQHKYQAPARAGFGFCAEDLLTQPPPQGAPTAHPPEGEVSIRYLDKEPKT